MTPATHPTGVSCTGTPQVHSLIAEHQQVFCRLIHTMKVTGRPCAVCNFADTAIRHAVHRAGFGWKVGLAGTFSWGPLALLYHFCDARQGP